MKEAYADRGPDEVEPLRCTAVKPVSYTHLFAGIFPAINAVLTVSTNANDKGRVFGLSYLAQQLGAVMGPIVGGAMTVYFSYKFIIGMSGFICLPLVLYLFLKRPAKTEGTGTPLV